MNAPLDVTSTPACTASSATLGSAALGVMPQFRQLFVTGATQRVTGMQLERMAFCLRKRAERETDVYFPSLSSRTLAYKGMLTTDQLDNFFPDLRDLKRLGG